ncbi:hypothetical protein ABZ397_19500 [Streptomyces sp. NPDC005876]|uniref:hypothetical protein n=1 Tax=Streptomyces sp. NPDC005876 TaxID=3157076 RepID=UPI0033D5CF07
MGVGALRRRIARALAVLLGRPVAADPGTAAVRDVEHSTADADPHPGPRLAEAPDTRSPAHGDIRHRAPARTAERPADPPRRPGHTDAPYHPEHPGPALTTRDATKTDGARNPGHAHVGTGTDTDRAAVGPRTDTDRPPVGTGADTEHPALRTRTDTDRPPHGTGADTEHPALHAGTDSPYTHAGTHAGHAGAGHERARTDTRTDESRVTHTRPHAHPHPRPVRRYDVVHLPRRRGGRAADGRRRCGG